MDKKEEDKSSRHLYNKQARLVMFLEDVWIAASQAGGYLKDEELDSELQKELERVSKKYRILADRLKKQHALSDNELAYVEAERVAHGVLYARDCILHSGKNSPEQFLPKKFVDTLLKMGERVLKFRTKFYMPLEKYQEWQETQYKINTLFKDRK